MVVGFADFGSGDVELYRQYLLTVVLNGFCGGTLGWGQGVDDCDVAGVTGGGSSAQPRVSSAGPTAVRAVLQGAFDVGGDGCASGVSGGGSGLVGQSGGSGADGSGPCNRCAGAGGGERSGERGERGVGGDVAAVDGVVGPTGVVAPDSGGSAGSSPTLAAALGSVESVPVRVAGQLKRGPNFARNQASRERKKQAKAAKARGGVSGRACGGGSGQLAGERKGFFSSCDEDLQKELRESRAKMLILENKRKEVQYARDVARLQSPAQLALDVVELMRKTQNDPKLGADPRIMGWAKTVVSAEAESVARSAPSSVPSLDSVVLSESEGSRASEYKRRYEELVLAYDNADCFNPGDRADDFRLLKVEFADVVKGDVRTASRFEFAREMQVAIAEAVSGGEYACSRAIESLIGEAMRLDDD